MNQSVTDSSGYKANVPIGSYVESPELSTEYSQINKAYQVADIPTNANSTKRTAPTLPAGLDSPANVGNSSC